MTRTRGPFLILAALSVALTVAASCHAWSLAVFLVVTKPSSESPILEPRFVECEDDCRDVRARLPGGDETFVRAEKRPREVFSPKDFEKVVVFPLETAIRGRSVWYVVASPTSVARTRLSDIAAAYPFDRVLIEMDGQATDVHVVATWSSGLRLSAFGDRATALEFAEKFALPIDISDG